MKLSKPQLQKIGKSEAYLGRFLGPLLKTWLPIMKNVLNPLAKSVLILLQLTAVAPATDSAIHTKVLRSGKTTSTILNKEMNDIIKIVNSLEESTS